MVMCTVLIQMGPVISDFNRWLILLSVTQWSGILIWFMLPLLYPQVALYQCFPKTGPRTIYGPPKPSNWSVKKFRSKNMLKYELKYHFYGKIWPKLVRSTTFWSTVQKSGLYGSRLEKVWEPLLYTYKNGA